MSATEEHARQAVLQLRERRQELAGQIQRVLRDTLFSSRVYVRPSDVGRLAQEETDVFFRFMADLDVDQATTHGVALCTSGLGDQALLRMSATYRRFLMLHLEESLHAQALELVDTYHEALLHGFVARREAIIFDEQEHIRSALQHALSRFTLQVETAAEVARATVSILDLGELLTTAVDLISERFGLDYAGIYLIDGGGRYAVLRAGTGDLGRRLLAAGHRLSLSGESTISRCIVERRHLITGKVSAAVAPPDSSWLANTRSEIALPLVSRDEVIGALTAQSQRMDAFSSQDAPGLQTMADQLASAISNAQLYREAQRRANELAALNARLQELDRLKNQFLQNVSHELRTPLTIIGGYAEAMLDGTLGHLEEDHQKAIEAIFRAAGTLGVLVDDIIALLEAGTREPKPQEVSMIDLCNSCLLEFQILAIQKGVTLQADFPETAIFPSVYVEIEHIRRVVNNLLSNAIKFTPNEGRVILRLYNIDDRIVLEVGDTGVGIPKELQDRIFDRFFQADGTIRRRFGGTGIGLALVKEFVELYGGNVAVRSPGEGQGSTFVISLPVYNGRAPAVVEISDALLSTS